MRINLKNLLTTQRMEDIVYSVPKAYYFKGAAAQMSFKSILLVIVCIAGVGAFFLLQLMRDKVPQKSSVVGFTAEGAPPAFFEMPNSTPSLSKASKIDQTMLEAVKRCDSKKVKAWLKVPSFLSGVDTNGWSALHWAAHKGCLRIVQELLESGANPNAKDGEGRTPIFVVLDRKIRPDEDTDFELTADIKEEARSGDPWYAAEALPKEHLEIMETLLQYGAEVNDRDLMAQTALYWAVAGGHDEHVESLIRHGATVNVSDDWGNTPFHIAYKWKRAAKF